MPHNSEDLIIKQKTPIAALPGCQTTANLRNLLGRLLLGRLLTSPGRFFSSSRPRGMVPSSPRSHPLTARRRCLTHSLFQERGRQAITLDHQKKRNKPNFLQPICNQWTTAGPSAARREFTNFKSHLRHQAAAGEAGGITESRSEGLGRRLAQVRPFSSSRSEGLGRRVAQTCGLFLARCSDNELARPKPRSRGTTGWSV